MNFDQAFIVEAAEIARNQLANGSQPRSQFLVILQKIDLYSCSTMLALIRRKPHEVGNQSTAHGGEGEIFNQPAHAPKAMSEHFDDLQRDLRPLQTNPAKAPRVKPSSVV